nr:hypothetical protein [uncultured Oscillibacter sp.]
MGHMHRQRAATISPLADRFKRQVEDLFQGAATVKGALLITPERVIVTTPARTARRSSDSRRCRCNQKRNMLP